ncbi:Uncharacterised protein [Cellulomonas fimi]|nr:Uncharacterised protein [Cellulomonas fimi]
MRHRPTSARWRNSVGGTVRSASRHGALAADVGASAARCPGTDSRAAPVLPRRIALALPPSSLLALAPRYVALLRSRRPSGTGFSTLGLRIPVAPDADHHPLDRAAPRLMRALVGPRGPATAAPRDGLAPSSPELHDQCPVPGAAPSSVATARRPSDRATARLQPASGRAANPDHYGTYVAQRRPRSGDQPRPDGVRRHRRAYLQPPSSPTLCGALAGTPFLGSGPLSGTRVSRETSARTAWSGARADADARSGASSGPAVQTDPRCSGESTTRRERQPDPLHLTSPAAAHSRGARYQSRRRGAESRPERCRATSQTHAPPTPAPGLRSSPPLLGAPERPPRLEHGALGRSRVPSAFGLWQPRSV